MSVSVLREAFRHYLVWRAAFEADQVPDTITAADGTSLCLWDIEYLRRQISLLSPRQHQAIELCLIQGIREKDAAEMMGVSRENPVMSYATNGLNRLLDMAEGWQLERFRTDNDGLLPEPLLVLVITSETDETPEQPEQSETLAA